MGNMGANIEKWSISVKENAIVIMAFITSMFVIILTVATTDIVGNVKESNLLYWLMLMQIIALLGNLCYVIYCNKLKKNRYLQEVDQALFKADIQQILLSSNKKPDSLTKVVRLLAGKLKAAMVFFTALDGKEVREVYCWPLSAKIIIDHSNNDSHMADIYKSLNNDNIVALDDKQVAAMKDAGIMGNLPGLNISNIIMVPVVISSKKLVGVLVVVNSPNVYAMHELLKYMAKAIMMAVNNIQSYSILRQLGTVDKLTGLLNRNAYHHNFSKYEYCGEQTGVIYIDVNGLHEINNSQGHAAGDKMLCIVANLVKSHWGKYDTYRIGGDEYVAFELNATEEVVKAKIVALKDEVEAAGYHVAVGIAFTDSRHFLQQTIALAEQAMYKDKRDFYATGGKAGNARIADGKIDKLLMKKRDQEGFIQIISANYLGVYAINLNTDDVRRILCTNRRAADLVEECEFSYSRAMEMYAKNFLDNDNATEFIKFTDSETIDKKICQNNNVELCYSRQDGVKIRLRVYQMADYCPENRNTLWIFEKIFG